ncbi:hypothetical protein QBC37DRAFT_421186 [Rhypophila decipiens]|uniref:Uncharacterized protein n=1 Tax=Rhypophila decipiens TaxID=261697 RepID=A0AAN6Y872_9PEZI|nr:hypothetical protein QBC37DRAFT_421186 [Rhypophila decipiens]
MAILSWGTVKSLLIFFGPVLIPKAISFYRSLKNAPKIHGLKIQPCPSAVFRSILLLLTLSIIFLVRTLPIFSPENVFAVTQSRLQIPSDVLFNRLSSIRPNGSLNEFDIALRNKFVNMESRLLYLQLGPRVLAECPFCSADEPNSYMYYALPDILWPHLFNWAVVALVTSRLVTGRVGAQWRGYATIAGILIAALDVYLVVTYNYATNRRMTRLQDLDFFYWKARFGRAVALAGLDTLLGLVMYLSSTNRAFVNPPSPAERIEGVTRVLGGVKGKINALGVVKNTASRDEELRARSTAYWNHEVRLMRDVMEEREVIEGMSNALENRIDIETITRDADLYAANMLQPLQQHGPLLRPPQEEKDKGV